MKIKSLLMTLAALAAGPLLTAQAPQTITFAAVPNMHLLDSPVTLIATSTSGLPVALSIISGSNVATITGDVLSLNGGITTGGVSIRARQSGDVNYSAAVDVIRAITVSKAVSVINFTAIPSTMLTTASPVTLSASAINGLPVFYELGGGTVSAALSGSTLSMTGSAGGFMIYAGTLADSTYAAGWAQQSVMVTAPPKTAQAISFATVPSTLLTSDWGTMLSASSTSGLSVSFEIVSGPAAISPGGNSLNLTGAAGTVVVRASQAGNTSYLAAVNVDQNITVSLPPKQAQTISFMPISADMLTTYIPITLSATASSGLPVTFVIVSGPGAVSGNILTRTSGTGTVLVRASQAGNASYFGTSADQSATIVAPPQAQTITFMPIDAYWLAEYSPVSLYAYASSGLPVTFAVVSGPATLNGNVLTRTSGGGTVLVRAAQAGNASFLAAAGVDQSVVIKTAQTITFATGGNMLTTDAARTLVATSTSGLPVAFYVYSGPATVSGNVLTLTGAAGTVIVQANQIGNTSYLTAMTVAQAIIVSVPAKQVQTITFASVPGNMLTTGSAILLSATSTSGLPVALAVVSGPATVSGNVLTLTGTAGTVVVRASQAGNTSYLAAVNVDQNITVSLPPKQAQTITFAPIPSTPVTSAPIRLVATSTSGLPVTFAVFSGPATISGDMLTVTVAGTVNLSATQAGDTNYSAATASQSVIVTPAGKAYYFGTIVSETTGAATGSFAACLDADGVSGHMIATVTSTPAESFAFPFTLAGGSFVVVTHSLASPDGPARTFDGIQLGPVFGGRIDELGLIFSALPIAAGSSSDVAGYYTAAAIGCGTGQIYSIVSPAGHVMIVSATVSTVTTLQDGSYTGTSGADTVTGTVIAPGSFTCGVVGPGGTVNFGGVGNGITSTKQFANISTRGWVGTGDNVMISGFVVSGPGAKTVLIRAVGKTLEGFGVVGALSDPRLLLFNGAGQMIAENDNWGASDNVIEIAAAFVETYAFGLALESTDAALLVTLEPGSYTAHVVSASGTGIALAEVYDATGDICSQPQKIINLSTRGFVGTGDGIMIGGLVIEGNTPKRVLIRAIGPTLGSFGVTGALADPVLMVFAGKNVVAQNDNWSAGINSVADISTASKAVWAFGLVEGSKDAAMVITLAPGSYTLQVSGTDGGTGVALVEAYEVD